MVAILKWLARRWKIKFGMVKAGQAKAGAYYYED